MLILAVPFLLLTKVILYWFYLKLTTFLRWGIKFINGKNFLLIVMWFFEFWSQVISHYPIKFDIHRTCWIGDIALFCQVTTCNHVLKESCDFVHGDPTPWAIILSSFVVISHVKTEILLFLLAMQLLCHVIIVVGDPFS